MFCGVWEKQKACWQGEKMASNSGYRRVCSAVIAVLVVLALAAAPVVFPSFDQWTICTSMRGRRDVGALEDLCCQRGETARLSTGKATHPLPGAAHTHAARGLVRSQTHLRTAGTRTPPRQQHVCAGGTSTRAHPPAAHRTRVADSTTSHPCAGSAASSWSLLLSVMAGVRDEESR